MVKTLSRGNEGYVSYGEFKQIIREGLRDLPNCCMIIIDTTNVPEFIVCLNGNFVAVKIKTLDLEGKDSDAARDIRDAGGLFLEVTRHNWPSVLKSLQFLSEHSHSLNS